MAAYPTAPNPSLLSKNHPLKYDPNPKTFGSHVTPLHPPSHQLFHYHFYITLPSLTLLLSRSNPPRPLSHSLSHDTAIPLNPTRIHHMDIPNPARHLPKKPSPSERFLGAYPHAPPPNSNLTPAPDVGDELTEDDILWTNDFAAAESNHQHHNSQHNNYNNHSTPPSSASSTPRRHHKGFSQSESFGILAALPDRGDASSSPNSRSHSHFYRKASNSSSSSSSPSYAQMIPTIPKPPPLQDHHHRSSFSSSFKYQSAPVNIPVLMSKKYGLEAVADEEDDDGEMLPPHEIVARRNAHSLAVAYSVLEGMGRTLKGRDLRRVRNAVWRRTGFLD